MVAGIRTGRESAGQEEPFFFGAGTFVEGEGRRKRRRRGGGKRRRREREKQRGGGGWRESMREQE